MKTVRRRRMEAKTDYKSRFALLKAEKPRLVVRKTSRYIIAQIVQSDIAQDKVLVGITSKDLLEKGWPKEIQGSLKNRTAAYLTGFLIGKLALEKGIKEAILDMGMYRNVPGSRVFSVLKGAVDAGLKVPHSPESLPSEEIIKNEKTEKIFNKIIKDGGSK